MGVEPAVFTSHTCASDQNQSEADLYSRFQGKEMQNQMKPATKRCGLDLGASSPFGLIILGRFYSQNKMKQKNPQK